MGARLEYEKGMGSAFFRFPSYESLFSVVRNHVLVRSELTGNANGDVEKIAQGLKQGSVYMSLDILGNPKGFNAVVRNSKGIHPMGARLEYEKGMVLEITLPQKPRVPFDTMIFKNGERMMTSNSQVTQYYINAPGVYRVMVRVIPTLPLPDGKKWIPWIYTNPFYIVESGSKVSGIRTTRPFKGGS
jgi:hypothetical protein